MFHTKRFTYHRVSVCPATPFPSVRRTMAAPCKTELRSRRGRQASGTSRPPVLTASNVRTQPSSSVFHRGNEGTERRDGFSRLGSNRFPYQFSSSKTRISGKISRTSAITTLRSCGSSGHLFLLRNSATEKITVSPSRRKESPNLSRMFSDGFFSDIAGVLTHYGRSALPQKVTAQPADEL
jgi:hypothetical protein